MDRLKKLLSEVDALDWQEEAIGQDLSNIEKSFPADVDGYAFYETLLGESVVRVARLRAYRCRLETLISRLLTFTSKGRERSGRKQIYDWTTRTWTHEGGEISDSYGLNDC